MTEMKLIETSLTEDFVTIRLADDPDGDEAHEWLELQVPVDVLKLGDVQKHPLGNIQAAALRHLRAAIDEVLRDIPTS